MAKQKILKVAAVQAAPVGFDLALSLKKLETLTAEAALAGANLVVFPYVAFKSSLLLTSLAHDLVT